MTDTLRHLLHEAAEQVEIPPPPTAAILDDGRRKRRGRQNRTGLTVAAGVLAAVGAIVAGNLPGDERSSRDPAETPDPTPTLVPPPAEPLEVSGAGVGNHPFGSDADTVVTDLSRSLGKPTHTVGPVEYVRIPGETGWYEAGGDNLSLSWRHPTLAVSCWRELCLVFGGDDADSLALRGWELADFDRWGGPEPDDGPAPARLVGTGITLGDSWAVVRERLPEVAAAQSEGQSIRLEGLPWPGIFDGAGAWRLSGAWAAGRPDGVPPGSVVTRLSGGEGPEPGCC